MLTIGSLFSGYGGLDIAAQSVLGGELAWYSEIEAAACTVLAAHHPDVPNLGDVTRVDWSTVPQVDVLTAGWPCQPFSHAGKRDGTNDERHLWPYVRDAVAALRPMVLVGENVDGHRSLGLDVVLGDLAALGMSARWGVVRASDAGAPHQRARVFIAAHSDSERRERNRATWVGRAGSADDDQSDANPESRGSGALGTGGDESRGSSRSRGGGKRAATDAARGTRGTRQGRGVSEPAWTAGLAAHDRDGCPTAANPDGGRHGLQQDPDGVDGVDGVHALPSRQRQRSRGVADAGGASDAAHTHRAGFGLVAERNGGTVPRLVTPLGDDLGRARLIDWGKYGPAIHRWERVLGRPAPAPTVLGPKGRPRLSPLFVEWLMGLPAGHVTGHGLSHTAELKMLGNGVVPQQAALALRLLLAESRGAAA